MLNRISKGVKMKFYGNQPKDNQQGDNFIEIIDVNANHSIVVGTISKGKANKMITQSSAKESVKPLFGERVSVLHQGE